MILVPFAYQIFSEKSTDKFKPTYELITPFILSEKGLFLGIEDSNNIENITFVFENMDTLYYISAFLTEDKMWRISEKPIPLYLLNDQCNITIHITFNSDYNLPEDCRKYFNAVLEKEETMDLSSVYFNCPLIQNKDSVFEIICGFVRVKLIEKFDPIQI